MAAPNYLTLRSTINYTVPGTVVSSGFVNYISSSGVSAWTNTLTSLSTLQVSTLVAASTITSNVNCSTMTISTSNAMSTVSRNVNCSTLIGSTLTSVVSATSNMSCSTLVVSSFSLPPISTDVVTCSTLYAVSTITSNVNCSTITVSTLTAMSTISRNVNYSTLTGSTVSAVSTITGNLNYSTLTGSTVNAVSTISGNVNCSTITVSTLNGTNLNAITIIGSTLTAGTAFSTNTSDTYVNGNLYMNSGFNSAGLSYGCRAWGIINSGNDGLVSTFTGGNLSNFVRTGVGKYTVTLTTAMPDINYSVVLTGSYPLSVNCGMVAENLGSARTTNTIYLDGLGIFGSVQSFADFKRICFAVYR